MKLLAFCQKHKINIATPWQRLSEEQRDLLLKATAITTACAVGFVGWKGKAYKMHVRVFLARYRGYFPCDACHGARIKPEALLYRVGGKTLAEINQLSVGDCYTFFRDLQLSVFQDQVAHLILEEIRKRMRFLVEVGLEYLTLDRQSRTLSGGELERVDLTTAIGSSLVNTLYILDEPSIGLHPRDSHRLVRILKGLRDNGNTVVVVEHDPEIIREADNILDMGPFAGEKGGDVCSLAPREDSPGQALADREVFVGSRMEIPVPERRRSTQLDKRALISPWRDAHEQSQRY